jgi:hypothetical protein
MVIDLATSCARPATCCRYRGGVSFDAPDVSKEQQWQQWRLLVQPLPVTAVTRCFGMYVLHTPESKEPTSSTVLPIPKNGMHTVQRGRGVDAAGADAVSMCSSPYYVVHKQTDRDQHALCTALTWV